MSNQDHWIETITENWECLAASPAEKRGSAVLIPLVKGENGETAVLFEHRAVDLDVQPDEICFPGGGIEPGETPLEAVVREAAEELLIEKEQLKILGETDGIERGGIVHIRAFVGVLEGYAGTFSKAEVDHVFTVPVSWLLKNPPRAYLTTVTTVPDEDFPFERIPGGRNYPWRKQRTPVFFYAYPGEVIWGLTAGILYHFTQKLSS